MSDLKEKSRCAGNEAAFNDGRTQRKHSTSGLFVIFCRNRHGRRFRYLRRPVSKSDAEEIVGKLKRIGLDAWHELEGES
jgi:hypothetical protein